MWKVYGLQDPRDGRVRYVGCTSMWYLSSRLAMHVNTARIPKQKGHLTPRSVWIRDVLDAGLRPVPVLFSEFPTKEEAYVVEKHLIQDFKDLLVNVTGRRRIYKPLTPEHRAKVGAASRRRVQEALRQADPTRTPEGKLTIFGAQKLAAESRRKKS